MSEITADSGEPFGTDENFAVMFEEAMAKSAIAEGTVVEGSIIAIENDLAVIDVGLKAEGRVPLKEFALPGQTPEVKVGDTVEVFLDRIENRHGEAMLSRERARREEAWVVLEKAFADNDRIEGAIFGRVKGGFTVDLGGAVAFLPGSQVDVRPVRDITPLMGSKQPFQILKMDRRRGNIVVSRRAVMEESRAEARAELMNSLKEGQVLEGVVKNITDYGAFVDLGEVDGLLHVTDIAWRRVNHPSEILSIGQTVNVQVIRFNLETQRISLGMKQLEADPWDGIEAKYPVRTKYTGRVTNITDYGAFVELEAGVEGLVHVSEMSWTKKNVHPGKIISTSQQVEVMVLAVDPQKRRISLGLKQCDDNPWDAFLAMHPSGAEIEGEVKNITEFGLFVGLPGDIDGLVHMSDLDWQRSGEEAIRDHKKGDMVKVRVVDVDIDKERISLGIKQLSEDPFAEAMSGIKKGSVVTGVVTVVQDNGIELSVDGAIGFVRKADLARDRGDQRPDRFAVGDKVDAKVTQIDQGSRRLSLSVKALEIQDEKKAMASYGSSDSGASLGDILGAAMSKAAEAKAEDVVEEAPDGAAEDASKDAGEGATADAAAELSSEAAKDAAEDASKDAGEGATTEDAAEPSGEAAEDAAEDASKDAGEGATADAAAEPSGEAAEDAGGGAADADDKA
jgi:small subunit ribosomal protein S1